MADPLGASSPSAQVVDPVLGSRREPLPAHVQRKIFEKVGREGCAAWQIARGTKQFNCISEEELLREPFNYWDWPRQLADHADRWKQHLLWERRRDYSANQVSGSDRFDDCKNFVFEPSSKESKEQQEKFQRNRWESFRTRTKSFNQMNVKKIAIPRFASLDDFMWVAKNLSRLNALDLSHCEAGTAARDALLAFMTTASSASRLFGRLNWLGVCDWRKDPELIPLLLSKCNSLQTLSVRGGYSREPRKSEVQSAHHEVCEFIWPLVDMVPATLECIQLRLTIPFLKRLIDELQRRKSHIRCIGIDLGAWVQTYPLRRSETRLEASEIIHSTMVAATHYRSSTYEEEHTRTFPVDSAWLLPELKPHSYQDIYLSSIAVRTQLPISSHNFYCESGGVDVEGGVPKDHSEDRMITSCPLDSSQGHQDTWDAICNGRVETLPRMLKKLQDAAEDGNATAARPRLFALEPEPQELSTNPISPLSLIQENNNAGIEVGAAYGTFGPKQLFSVYKWLNETFQWRPVFDWDWFMTPVSQRNSTLDPAYRSTSDLGIEKEDVSGFTTDQIKKIVGQFRSLNEASIPVHILIGRRNPNLSSLYWDFQPNESNWENFRNTFNTYFDEIAGLVDVLSIFYDLRSPLSDERLHEIDDQESYDRPNAPCPGGNVESCPWKMTGDCPFKWHREIQSHPSRKIPARKSRQKIPNGRELKGARPNVPQGYDQLAAGCASCPMTGENANDHPSDDSDEKSDPDSMTLHRLARRAAYTREAMGWQLFWSTYALKFTRLIKLRVRMPRCFDKIGSWRLAQLIDPSVGWSLIAYTDERQHVQSREDVLRPLPGVSKRVFDHIQERKVWPAGRFVRRTWIRDSQKLEFENTGPDDIVLVKRDGTRSNHFTKKIVISKVRKMPQWKERRFTQKDYDDTRDREEEEYQKAEKRSRVATIQEAEYETEHGWTQNKARLKVPLDPTCGNPYGAYVRSIVSRTWRTILQGYINDIEDDLTRRTTGISADPSQPSSECELLRRTSQKLQSLLNSPPYAEILSVQRPKHREMQKSRDGLEIRNNISIAKLSDKEEERRRPPQKNDTPHSKGSTPSAVDAVTTPGPLLAPTDTDVVETTETVQTIEQIVERGSYDSTSVTGQVNTVKASGISAKTQEILAGDISSTYVPEAPNGKIAKNASTDVVTRASQKPAKRLSTSPESDRFSKKPKKALRKTKSPNTDKTAEISVSEDIRTQSKKSKTSQKLKQDNQDRTREFSASGITSGIDDSSVTIEPRRAAQSLEPTATPSEIDSKDEVDTETKSEATSEPVTPRPAGKKRKARDPPAAALPVAKRPARKARLKVKNYVEDSHSSDEEPKVAKKRAKGKRASLYVDDNEDNDDDDSNETGIQGKGKRGSSKSKGKGVRGGRGKSVATPSGTSDVGTGSEASKKAPMKAKKQGTGGSPTPKKRAAKARAKKKDDGP